MPESQGRAGCGFLGGTIILDVLMRLRDPDLEICQSWSQTVRHSQVTGCFLCPRYGQEEISLMGSKTD